MHTSITLIMCVEMHEMKTYPSEKWYDLYWHSDAIRELNLTAKHSEL